MAISLEVFRAQVDSLISAIDRELSELERHRIIKSALERYSVDAPDDVTEDETGDGGKYYPITGASGLLADWIEGFSRVAEIEYPAQAISADAIPQYLELDDFRDDYWQGGVRYLFFPNHSPGATETLRIRYTVPYLWTASSIVTAVNKVGHGFVVNDFIYLAASTWTKATDQRIATHKVTAVADADNFTAALLEIDIPVGDFFAVCHLAAGFCCQTIATEYSRSNDSTINADSVNHYNRGVEFAKRAKEFIALYERHLGIDKESRELAAGSPAGDFIDWDTAPGWPSGRDYIFHGKGTR